MFGYSYANERDKLVMANMTTRRLQRLIRDKPAKQKLVLAI